MCLTFYDHSRYLGAWNTLPWDPPSLWKVKLHMHRCFLRKCRVPCMHMAIQPSFYQILILGSLTHFLPYCFLFIFWYKCQQGFFYGYFSFVKHWQCISSKSFSRRRCCAARRIRGVTFSSPFAVTSFPPLLLELCHCSWSKTKSCLAWSVKTY